MKEYNLTKDIDRRENNAFSQQILQENKGHFKGQCKTVIEALLRGERLTTASALIKYGIGDLRRRIKDLKDIYKIDCIKEELQKSRYKVWYIEIEDYGKAY